MAKKYENVEKILELLGDEKLGGLQKRLSATEKNLSEILKNLAVKEAEKAERELAEATARAEEEARKAEEERQAKEAEKALENTVVPETVEEVVEEKPKKKTSKKQVEEVAEAPQETAIIEEPAGAPVEEKTEEKKAQQKTYTPKAETAGAPRAPRYFRNGQEQGVYVAKAGVETTQSYGSTYRPRTQGAPSTRPQGGSFAGRPATGGARPVRPSVSATPVNAPMMPDGRLDLLDADELDEALEQGDITQEQHQLAHQWTKELMTELPKNLPRLKAFCEELFVQLKEREVG